VDFTIREVIGAGAVSMEEQHEVSRIARAAIAKLNNEDLQSLAVAFMAHLDDIRFNTRVAAIHRTDAKIGIHSDSGQYIFDAAIIAVPLPILRKLEFHPALPHLVQEAIDGIPMGVGAKLIMPTVDRPPIRGRLQAPSAGTGEKMTASGVSPGVSYELPAYDSPQANPSLAARTRPRAGRKRYAPDDRLGRWQNMQTHRAGSTSSSASVWPKTT
jgi:hypothetical protein